MTNVYILMADWDWEGQDPLKVYSSKDKADHDAGVANEYNDLRPRNPALRDDFDTEAWEEKHPFPEGARCWRFVVKEVPLDLTEL